MPPERRSDDPRWDSIFSQNRILFEKADKTIEGIATLTTKMEDVKEDVQECRTGIATINGTSRKHGERLATCETNISNAKADGQKAGLLGGTAASGGLMGVVIGIKLLWDKLLGGE